MVVKIQLFVTNYYNKEKIETKKDTIDLTMTHNIKFEVDPNFSIKKVECLNCGASFDAIKDKHCPYCSTEYNPEDKD